MPYNLTFNYFHWVQQFETVIATHLKNPDLPYLANQFAMMGVGKKFNDDGSLEYPQDTLSQQYNEIVHCLVRKNNLLETLRGFFEYDCRLDEGDDLKVLSKGADEDIVDFLVETPDPRYFTPQS